jgi:hypothetical protein
MKLTDIFYKISNWESWHHHVKYIPLSPVWVWYCLRSGSPWFFTATNPTLTFGGFEGEGKKEMYEQLPPGSYPNSIYISPALPFEELLNKVKGAGFEFPFIAKPDVGMMGFMVRKISTPEQLQQYHTAIPANYIIQTLVDYPLEVSAFYYRMPGEKKGTISGLLKKQPPYVTGDGKSSLLELIQANQHIRFKQEDIIARNNAQLESILPEGSTFYLSVTSNRSQAGIVEGCDNEITDTLSNLLDEWSLYKGSLFYGRYDIKCASLASLKEGKDFSILEFNGTGAGIQHITGNNYSFFKAIGIILQHWKMMYLIGRKNNKLGVPYWKTKNGWKHLKLAKQNLMMLKKLDAAFPSFL